MKRPFFGQPDAVDVARDPRPGRAAPEAVVTRFVADVSDGNIVDVEHRRDRRTRCRRWARTGRERGPGRQARPGRSGGRSRRRRRCPAAPMSTAERRITSKSWVASSVGRAVHTHALAPETSGAAKLVPSPFANPCRAAVAIGISTPGATRSTKRERLEKDATALTRSEAPTVSTCGMLAGYPSGLPWSPSLPDAATISVPFRDCFVDRLLDQRAPCRSEPRLRLTTPGPLFAAARIPWTISVVVELRPLALGRRPTSGGRASG